jgi:hypothetical protein
MKEEVISLSWPLVDYNRRKRSRTPRLYFDIGFDPREPLNVKVDRGGCYTTITSDERSQPVSTHCKLTKMTILCPGLLAMWPVKVRRAEGITCFDVFLEIYETFHQVLTPAEKALIPRDFFNQKFEDEFKMRCKECPRISKVERKKGYRRVDLLRGRRIFQGVERSGADWELTIDRMEAPRRS